MNLPKNANKSIRVIFLMALLAISFFNAVGLWQENQRIWELKKHVSRQIIGSKFAGLEEFTRGIDSIGYYTDMDDKDEEQSKLFSHAQFVLAPTILDFNNLDHEYVLFVCNNKLQALRKIKDMGAEPFKVNPLGMILAKRKP